VAHSRAQQETGCAAPEDLFRREGLLSFPPG